MSKSIIRPSLRSSRKRSRLYKLSNIENIKDSEEPNYGFGQGIPNQIEQQIDFKYDKNAESDFEYDQKEDTKSCNLEKKSSYLQQENPAQKKPIIIIEGYNNDDDLSDFGKGSDKNSTIQLDEEQIQEMDEVMGQAENLIKESEYSALYHGCEEENKSKSIIEKTEIKLINQQRQNQIPDKINLKEMNSNLPYREIGSYETEEDDEDFDSVIDEYVNDFSKIEKRIQSKNDIKRQINQQFPQTLTKEINNLDLSNKISAYIQNETSYRNSGVPDDSRIKNSKISSIKHNSRIHEARGLEDSKDDTMKEVLETMNDGNSKFSSFKPDSHFDRKIYSNIRK